MGLPEKRKLYSSQKFFYPITHGSFGTPPLPPQKKDNQFPDA